MKPGEECVCSIFITVQHSVLLPDEIYHISVSALLSISVHRIFAGKIIGATYIQFYNDIFFFIAPSRTMCAMFQVLYRSNNMRHIGIFEK